jgi:hypothetical protein
VQSEREGRLLMTMVNVLTAGMSDPSRLARGRTYAKQGAVMDLDVVAGVLTATVQGSRAHPYEVTVHVTGAESFGNRTALIPTRDEIRFSCSCPDAGHPCKHGIAVMVAFADEIADDPSLLARWRGAGQASDAPRAVVGSRASAALPSSPVLPGRSTLDDDARARLEAFLGTPAEVEPSAVSRLRPPAAAWGDLWAEMLADALDVLTDDSATR